MCAAFACSRTPDRARSRTEYRLGGDKVGRAVGRRVRDRADELERGREAYAARAWLQAYECLEQAHTRDPLDPPDLELLSIVAFMLGRDDDCVAWLERAHLRASRARRDVRPAVRCAAWIGLNLASRGEIGPASGWLGRAQRLVEPEGECAERGYLLLPAMFQHEAEGRLRRRCRGRRGGRASR